MKAGRKRKASASLANLIEKNSLPDRLQGYSSASVAPDTLVKTYLRLAYVELEERNGLSSIEHFERAMSAAEDHAARVSFGNGLQELGFFVEAAAQYVRALKLKPDSPMALNNLGCLYSRQRSFREALDCFTQALTFDPCFVDALLNRGNLYAETHDLARAVIDYKLACNLAPERAEAHMACGKAMHRLGNLEQAIGYYDAALNVYPQWPEAHYAKAQTLLLNGNLLAAWPDFEWRRRCDGIGIGARFFNIPQWSGERLDGKRILLHAEQGLGDCIQFLRYLPLVKASGADIVLLLPLCLHDLVAHLPEVSELVLPDTPSLNISTHSPLMSLPGIFGTDLSSIPVKSPYLSVPHHHLLENPAYGIERKPELHVGLVWSGNPLHVGDATRSIPFTGMAALTSMSGVKFYSLQLENTEAASPNAQMAFPLLDKKNAVATASVIMSLDLVISVDTFVAHLAAALGKPVWILLPSDPDWRWLTDRGDSPWYPTVRLFRQEQRGDWSGVISRVTSSLESLKLAASSRDAQFRET